ncbi:hypothetical protein [Pectinatus haikarae]|uniref:Uncharacterized protein n=1 Tax=Pectinatus haikarae TaxID=349096 RepID=A0ABT9Y9K7_9FIRM|nr:hypothetical protein [Pectinatus haikarae]MDQ0204313.1 hypothetical protein [Pectinatus haikarae]
MKSSKKNILIYINTFFYYFFFLQPVYADTAIDVPNQVYNTVENAKNDYNIFEQKEQEQEYVKKAAEYIIMAEKELERAKQSNLDARDRLVRDQKWLEEAVQDKQNAVNEFARVKEIGATNDVIEEKEKEVYKADDNLQRAAKEMELAKKDKNLAEEYIPIAQANLEKATKQRDDLFYKINHPVASTSFITGFKYYNWDNGNETHGFQFIQPMNYSYYLNGTYLGIYTNHVITKNSIAGTSGTANTMTDTKIYFKKSLIRKKYTTEYSVDLNLPTGEYSLNGKEASSRVGDDLAEIDKYGEGFQVKPGIDFKRRLNRKETVMAGTSYLMRTPYDEISDKMLNLSVLKNYLTNNILPDEDGIATTTGKIHPGNEWNKFFRYQYATGERQFIADIINTTYGRSFYDNGISYQSKSEWKFRLTNNQKIARNQELLTYFWTNVQGTDYYSTQVSKSEPVYFYGAKWEFIINPRQKLRLSADVMQTSGSRYSGLLDGYDFGYPDYIYNEVAGRRKYSLGIGYDIAINKTSSLHIDLKKYYMKDGISTINQIDSDYSAQNYKGYGIFMLFDKQL